MTDEQIKKIAERLFNFIDPWDRDYMTAEELETEVRNDPAAVINYLIDYIEG